MYVYVANEPDAPVLISWCSANLFMVDQDSWNAASYKKCIDNVFWDTISDDGQLDSSL